MQAASPWRRSRPSKTSGFLTHRSPDDGLKSLGNLTNLKRLTVANTAVSDEGLKSLENLRRLEYLDVYGTQVSKQGAATLKEKLPSLTRVDGP